MPPLIQIRNLHHTYEVRMLATDRVWWRALFAAEYRMHTVLRDLSLTIEGRGVTAIVGRNGSGKTTLLKILTGILRASNGFVQVLGHDPTRRHKNLLRNIGVVFGQKKMLWPELSLRENFRLTRAMYALPAAAAEARSDALIAQFQLKEFVDRPVKSYSLGEAMRAELANILLCEPRVLFLDEPTIGMDLPAQIRFRRTLQDYLRDRHCHVILTSHNTRDIAELATRVLCLENGQLSEFALNGESLSALEIQLEEKILSL